MSLNLKAHHQDAINNLIEAYQDDHRFPAIIIGGSVAKQCARDDSDVDFMIVASDEEYNTRRVKGDLFINRTDLCNYPGGFVDGKVIPFRYLQQVSERGNEPSRAAFDGAFIAYSNIKELETILKTINTYPEAGRDDRIRAFYCMAFIQNWLMGEAQRHGNIYTKARAASQLSFYAGRLVLAYNRILFPYHKWFLYYLEKCQQKPANLIEDIGKLLSEPTAKNANTLFESIKSFRDWDISDHDAYMWFMTEVEWGWMDGAPPLEDL